MVGPPRYSSPLEAPLVNLVGLIRDFRTFRLLSRAIPTKQDVGEGRVASLDLVWPGTLRHIPFGGLCQKE